MCDYVLAGYSPNKDEACFDFKHLKNRLLNIKYEDIEDFDDDYLFFIRTYYYSLFENLDVNSRNELYKSMVNVLIKRKEYMVN